MSARLLLASVALLFCMSVAAVAQVIKVDPKGEPADLQKGNAIRYFVWFDDGAWHLRTDTAGKKHSFSGTVEIVGGKVTTISDFENLEGGKKKKKSDLGQLNQKQDEIAFKFTTSKKRDGFDFQVDGAAKQVRFKLLIDGKPAPERIFIGARAQPAPMDAFEFPAAP
jgi:hypothetical protein